MRIKGGTAGLLAAIFSGRLDPLDANAPPDPPNQSRYANAADRRLRDRRARQRLKKAERRERMAQAEHL